MKNNVLCFFLLIFSVAGIFPAKASESTLTISGDVVASVCEVTFTKKITIGSFSGKDFPSVGSNSAFKAMNINLSNCYSKLASVSVKFSGTPDADNPVLLALSETETGTTLATGIGIELLDNGGKTIPFNKSESKTFPLDEGENTLSFLLRYKSTKYPVTPGDATAVLFFDLSYQ